MSRPSRAGQEAAEVRSERRSASLGIQAVALLLGAVEGFGLGFAVVMPVVAVLLWLLRPIVYIPTESADLPVSLVCIAFCAYFLAAPAGWRGLLRRALLVVAISLLGFAILGYVLAFLGMPLGGMPFYDLWIQFAILAVGAGGVAGFIHLRERQPVGASRSATIPAPETALSDPSPDSRS